MLPDVVSTAVGATERSCSAPWLLLQKGQITAIETHIVWLGVQTLLLAGQNAHGNKLQHPPETYIAYPSFGSQSLLLVEQSAQGDRTHHPLETLLLH